MKQQTRTNIFWKVKARDKVSPARLFADTDRDGVANVFDCRPRNPRRQDNLVPGPAAMKYNNTGQLIQIKMNPIINPNIQKIDSSGNITTIALPTKLLQNVSSAQVVYNELEKKKSNEKNT